FDNILNSPFPHDKYNEKYDKIFSKINDLKQIKTASLLLNYLLDTQKRELEHLQIIEEIKNEDYVVMDQYTKKALELTTGSKSNDKYGSLYWLLDHTKTAMGSRMLKQWIERPLLNQQQIEQRLDVVEIFTNYFIQRESIKEILKD